MSAATPIILYPVLERLLAQKLVVWHGDLLALSDSGLLLANQVMAELV